MRKLQGPMIVKKMKKTMKKEGNESLGKNMPPTFLKKLSTRRKNP